MKQISDLEGQLVAVTYAKFGRPFWEEKRGIVLKIDYDHIMLRGQEKQDNVMVHFCGPLNGVCSIADSKGELIYDNGIAFKTYKKSRAPLSVGDMAQLRQEGKFFFE